MNEKPPGDADETSAQEVLSLGQRRQSLLRAAGGGGGGVPGGQTVNPRQDLDQPEKIRNVGG